MGAQSQVVQIASRVHFLRCAVVVRSVLAILVILGGGQAAFAQGPTLGMSGDRFTVNGAAKQLLIVDYFDGLDGNDGTWREDFGYLRDVVRADGIRVLPNWHECQLNCNNTQCAPDNSQTLFMSSGSLNPGLLGQLKALIGVAGEYGLIVDVTFTRDTVPGLSPDGYKNGIRDATIELAFYRNVLFDLQNEWNIHGFFDTDIRDIRRDYVDPYDGPRVVTGSTEQGYGNTESGIFARQMSMDAANHHEPRAYPGWQENTDDAVNQIRNGLAGVVKPIYLGEPTAWQDDGIPDHFSRAWTLAKAAGAAAWTFHTRCSFDLDGTSLKASMDPTQKSALENLNTIRVSLQANNGQWVVAEGGGGGEVLANRDSPGPWETFAMIDLGNDNVALRADNGQYFVAEGGGGGPVLANRNSIGSWETFHKINLGGGYIALQAANGQYVVAEGGGGGVVNANRDSIGAWETFFLWVR